MKPLLNMVRSEPCRGAFSTHSAEVELGVDERKTLLYSTYVLSPDDLLTLEKDPSTNRIYSIHVRNTITIHKVEHALHLVLFLKSQHNPWKFRGEWSMQTIRNHLVITEPCNSVLQILFSWTGVPNLWSSTGQISSDTVMGITDISASSLHEILWYDVTSYGVLKRSTNTLVALIAYYQYIWSRPLIRWIIFTKTRNCIPIRWHWNCTDSRRTSFKSTVCLKWPMTWTLMIWKGNHLLT